MRDPGGTAMADSNDQQQPTGQPGASPKPGVWKQLLGFDSWLHSAASLSIVTLIAGWVGTYIQYINAYEQKVSATAQADMKDATAALMEISNAYADAQMLQQLIYFNYAAAMDDTDAGDKGMITKSGQDIYQDYIGAKRLAQEQQHLCAQGGALHRLAQQSGPRSGRNDGQ